MLVYQSRFTLEQVNADVSTIVMLIKARMRERSIEWSQVRLHSGRLRPNEWDNEHQFLKQIGWKITEVCGKLIGCPYWSVAARDRFMQAWNPIRDDPRRSPYALARRLGQQVHGPNRLQHECRATIKVREPDNQDERVFRGLC
jgi:hypothetical protein